MAFVGTKTLESLEALQEFLKGIEQEHNYYFLRSPHKVSGIQSELPENINSVTEGQVFNSQWELRWKKKRADYELLLLSSVKPDSTWEFHPLTTKPANQSARPIEWQIEDRNALLYEANEIRERENRSRETRFPKGFTHNKPKIGQRYFLDSQTSTVHFVAITVSA